MEAIRDQRLGAVGAVEERPGEKFDDVEVKLDVRFDAELGQYSKNPQPQCLLQQGSGIVPGGVYVAQTLSILGFE